MSAINYFLEKGFTPQQRSTVINNATTISVWTPETGKRVFLTNMTISTNTGGTISFHFDNNTSYRFFETHMGGSVTISPMIGCIESTTVSGLIFARTNGGGTSGFIVNLTGFEI